MQWDDKPADSRHQPYRPQLPARVRAHLVLAVILLAAGAAVLLVAVGAAIAAGFAGAS